MDLETWLQEKGMHPSQLQTMLGKSRVTIWRARRNKPIDEATAREIYLITGGKVNPPRSKVGRAKGFKLKK